MMCRYDGFGGHLKGHFVCVDCQVGFKSVYICPLCKNEMACVGMDFRIPRKTNDREWRKIRMLMAAGMRFPSGCGCTGPGYIPRTLLDAKDYLENGKMVTRSKKYTYGKYDERPKRI